MTSVHGKDHEIEVGGIDLTTFIKTHNWEVTPDVHDITGGGVDDKSKRGGQIERSVTIGGWFDSNLTTGPGILQTWAGETKPFERRVYGTGTGRPLQTGSVVVGKYVESGKNDDITQWTCDLAVTGAVVETTQA